ncbi:MAG: proline dehydrogenase family protein [Nitrospirae bacterium]|nr:proline dehydrogenase family protein [Nitrospirota bacterium]
MTQDLETRIRKTAEDIYASVGGEVPSLFDTRKWMGRIMESAMRDETFRFQLFRFVDVLPSLKEDSLVVRLLHEYFGGEVNAPPLIQKGIERLGRGLGSHLAAGAIRAGVGSLARQFIAGRDPRDALRPLKSLREDGFAFSVDLLGEVVVSEREVGEYLGRYLSLIEFLHGEVGTWKEDPVLERGDRGPVPRCDISIKVSSLYSQLDPVDWDGSLSRTKENLRPLFRKAEEAGASLCFDMEHYYAKDLIVGIFRNAVEEFNYPYAGIALQAYLNDTREDLSGLIEWAKMTGKRISIRLVKGAYWDYETVINRQRGWPVPVFLNKYETDLSFEELTRTLLENHEFVRPAIATHNLRSVSNAIAFAEAGGIPKNSFEFQMLYGMGEPLRKVLRKRGFRVRVYSPVGELVPGMAYLVRRLLENTSNESFVRQFFAEKRPFDELIKLAAAQPEVPSEAEGFRNEPATDFSKAANRARMKDALEEARNKLGRRYPLSIGSGEVFTERETVSADPAVPGRVIGKVAVAGPGEAERAVEEARRAWETWKRVPARERAAFLYRAAGEMRQRRSELAAFEVYETGKTWKEADADVAEAVDYLEYYGREMERLGKPGRLGDDYPGERNEYRYEPRGIGVVISPWNFPLAIPAGMISAGVVTGNCVIFKPSGLSPVCGWMLTEVFRLAGLPPGVLQFLPGRGDEVGNYLVSHSGTDFIAFTGSGVVGLEILKRTGETHPGQRSVKRVIAEMGGKNAVIVDETADLDEAVAGVVESSIGYQGQKCSACSRVIVAGEIFDEFCDRLSGAMESICIGPPERPGSSMGPVIDETAYKKIQGYIELGRKEGKTVFERKSPGAGLFIGPAIFTDVEVDSRLAQEEIFGPVLVVLKAGSIDEALALAGRTRYALTGGIYSRSPVNIGKAREEFMVGNLYVNRKITGALVGRQPFGGFAMSGVGSKAGGPDYLVQFMNPRSISENTLRRGFTPRGDPRTGEV